MECAPPPGKCQQARGVPESGSVGHGKGGRWFAGRWEGCGLPEPSPNPCCQASFPHLRNGVDMGNCLSPVLVTLTDQDKQALQSLCDPLGKRRGWGGRPGERPLQTRQGGCRKQEG